MDLTFTRQGSRPKPYTITRTASGRLTCDCPSWLNKRNGQPRGCKHCADVAAVDLQQPIQQREDGQYVTVADVPAAFVKAMKAPAAKPVRIVDPAVAPAYRPLMLADKVEPFRWSDYPASAWSMEQKFDGERCLVAVRAGHVTAWSRAGRDAAGKSRDGLHRDLAPQIIAALATLPDCDLDGEVIVKGVGLMSSDVRALVNRAVTVFVAFDLLALRGQDTTDMTYDDRRTLLENTVENSAAVIVTTRGKPDQAMYAAIVAAGGEGVILKRRDSRYVGRRDGSAWVKVKTAHDEVVEIIGFEDSKVNSAKNAVILFRMRSGIESKCKTLNADWSRRIAAGTIRIGTKIEVTYQALMASGKPRHAMAKRVVGEGDA